MAMGSRLQALTLTETAVSAGDLQLLPCSLTSLRMKLSDKPQTTIAQLERFTALQELHFNGGRLTPEAVWQLAASPQL